jgi:type IV pilus assembly protein PilC
MLFSYTAKDPLGHSHEGSLEAATRDDAVQKLGRDGFHVVKIDEEEEESLNLFPRSVRRSEVVYLTSQLAIMVDTGINLASALESLYEQEDNPTLKRVLGELKEDVEGGDDFSSALAKHPKQFDKTYLALVRASERTGRLGSMLDQIAFYLRKELDNQGKVKAAMAYPAITLVLATGVTTFLLTYIMPKFTPLFSRKGAKLPMITSVMMSVSNAMVHYWYLWLLAIIVVVVGILYGRKTASGRRLIDWLKINVPIAGTAFRKLTISRSIRTLGTLLESGVPLLDSLRLTAEVSGNHYYEQAWLGVREKVTNGDRIAESLDGNPLFPKTLVQMINSGEATGKLDFVLKKVSGYYDVEVEAALKTATSLIEPIMISVMGGVVGTIAMSLLLPIFTLSRGH